MTVLYIVLLALAAAAFLVAASNKVVTNVNLLAVGLFLWVLVPLLSLIDSQS